MYKKLNKQKLEKHIKELTAQIEGLEETYKNTHKLIVELRYERAGLQDKLNFNTF